MLGSGDSVPVLMHVSYLPCTSTQLCSLASQTLSASGESGLVSYPDPFPERIVITCDAITIVRGKGLGTRLSCLGLARELHHVQASPPDHLLRARLHPNRYCACAERVALGTGGSVVEVMSCLFGNWRVYANMGKRSRRRKGLLGPYTRPSFACFIATDGGYYSVFTFFTPGQRSAGLTLQQQRDVLNKLHPDLRRLDLGQIFPHLNQQRLLTYSEQEKLNNERFTTDERIDELLKWIPKKGYDALERFVKCLENSADGTGHGELASSLEVEMRRIRSKQQHNAGLLQSFKGNCNE